jgi:hypothetical protein
MSLDLKAEPFQQFGDGLCGTVAIAGRIVRRNLDDLGQEAGLRFGMFAHEIVDRAFDRRHRMAPSSTSELSTRIPS